jgi:hypothetical protein
MMDDDPHSEYAECPPGSHHHYNVMNGGSSFNKHPPINPSPSPSPSTTHLLMSKTSRPEQPPVRIKS